MTARISFSRRTRALLTARHAVAAIVQTVLARIVVAGLSVGTGIVTSRCLGVQGRGEQSAMILWPTLLSYLLCFGVPIALRYTARRNPGDKAKIYTVSLVAAIIASCLVVAVGYAFIPLWLHQYSKAIVSFSQLMMFFAPEVMLGLVLVAMLETEGDFALSNRVRMLAVLMTFVALLFLAAARTFTPFYAALAYLVPNVVTSVWLLWHLRAQFERRAFDPRAIARSLASYGLRSYSIDVLNALSLQIDQVLVIGLLSATSMGIYVAALSASRVLSLIIQAVVPVLFQRAAKLEPPAVIALVARTARVTAGLMLSCSAALAVLMPALIPAVYGRQFAAAIIVAQILTGEALLSGLVTILAQAFLAAGKPAVVAISQIVGIAAAIPLIYLFSPHFGLVGVAIAIVISSILRLSCILGLYPLALDVPIPSLIPKREDLAQLRLSLAGGFVA